MALYTTLKVYQDTYKLILYLFSLTKQFPREYKYSLGQDMKKVALELVKNIYLANRSYEKEKYLEKFLENFEILKLEIQIAVDLNIISIKQNVNLAEKIAEIGKQINGWKKSLKKTKKM